MLDSERGSGAGTTVGLGCDLRETQRNVVASPENGMEGSVLRLSVAFQFKPRIISPTLSSPFLISHIGVVSNLPSHRYKKEIRTPITPAIRILSMSRHLSLLIFSTIAPLRRDI